MTQVRFKLRQINGSIPDDIIGRMHFNDGVTPVLGTQIKIKKTLVNVTQIIIDGPNQQTLIVDKVNPNKPYLDPATIRNTRNSNRRRR
jgi:hypothetical protein